VSLLEVQNLTKRFGGLLAIDSCDFEFELGTVVSLIGPNGAGKTTLFNLISGITKITSGEILFREQRIDGLKTHEIALMGIGRTFQNTRLFSEVTVLENVAIGGHSHGHCGILKSLFRVNEQRKEEQGILAKAKEKLNFVNLYHRRNDFGGNLAYGDQKRLEIARALMVEPSLLMLDEPNSGMNDQETTDLVDLIRRIRQKDITIVIVSHHMRFVKDISDRIIVLNHGKIIAEGKPEQVMRNENVIESYLGKAS
jgi:branched-chain amino acid transport system ATP-binding protein